MLASDQKARLNTDVPKSTLNADPCKCSYSPCVQLHASPSVCTLKIPNTGSHIIGHVKILHTLSLVGMGSAALASAVAILYKETPISHMALTKSKKRRILTYTFQLTHGNRFLNNFPLTEQSTLSPQTGV